MEVQVFGIRKSADTRAELLRMPLVRFQNQLTVGPAEAFWRNWTGK